MPGAIRLRCGTMRGAKEQKMTESTIDEFPVSKLRPILPEALTEDIPLEKVYVGRLKEKQRTSEAIRFISSSSPGFGHLKRCSGSRLLLSPCDVSANELKDTLLAKGFDLSLLEDEFEVFEIPSKPARTKRQAETCGLIWPLNFHPDQRIESIISGDVFTPRELAAMELLMRPTIEAARISSIGNSHCNGSALIVDPHTGQPVAIASSKLDEHPLFHAAMLAIDLVAKIHGGGAWDLINDDDDERTIQNHTSASSSALPERNTNKKRTFFADTPLRYPPSLRDLKFPKPEPFESSTTKYGQKNKHGDDCGSGKNSGTPYLCTNLWIFLLQEPCAMCAMALIHSRASKIFYGVTGSSGVLGSKAMLHTTPGINHRYQVWSGILENECLAVRDEIKTREINR